MQIDKNTTFYITSKLESEVGTVSTMDGSKLCDAIHGAKLDGRNLLDDHLIFTDKEQAEKVAKRLELLKVANMRLRDLEMDDLEQVVEALSPQKIQNTLEGLHVYTE